MLHAQGGCDSNHIVRLPGYVAADQVAGRAAQLKAFRRKRWVVHALGVKENRHDVEDMIPIPHAELAELYLCVKHFSNNDWKSIQGTSENEKQANSSAISKEESVFFSDDALNSKTNNNADVFEDANRRKSLLVILPHAKYSLQLGSVGEKRKRADVVVDVQEAIHKLAKDNTDAKLLERVLVSVTKKRYRIDLFNKNDDAITASVQSTLLEATKTMKELVKKATRT
jgi:hypothetical protein